jgi:mannose-6-phosphate isomerase-like protein (cupin superfamily)
LSRDLTDKEKHYFSMFDEAKPKGNVQKYSLDRSKLKQMYGMNNKTYLYQRCRVPEDKRYSIAYGIINPRSSNEWFYWYDEVIVTLKGQGKIVTRTRPAFDKEESSEVGEGDIFFVGKGTQLQWINEHDEEWVYMIVAMPAAAQD